MWDVWRSGAARASSWIHQSSQAAKSLWVKKAITLISSQNPFSPIAQTERRSELLGILFILQCSQDENWNKAE
jgi:hypothetical protein